MKNQDSWGSVVLYTKLSALAYSKTRVLVYAGRSRRDLRAG